MRKILLGLFLLAGLQLAHAQDAALPYSQRMARTAMKVWADTSKPHWTYEQGVV